MTQSITDTIPMTPDQETEWTVQGMQGSETKLYLAPHAPLNAETLLTSQLSGQKLYQGKYGTIYPAGDNYMAQESAPWDPRGSSFEIVSGLAALCVNVSFRKGLEAIQEKAELRSGACITAPDYLGAVINPTARSSRWLMTRVVGRPPSESDEDQDMIMSKADRRVVYARALEAVGVDPFDAVYNDERGDLLVNERSIIKFGMTAWRSSKLASLLTGLGR